jgi:hypothetical protein
MATKKISALPACGPLSGTEKLPLVQGSTTVSATLDELPLSTAARAAVAALAVTVATDAELASAVAALNAAVALKQDASTAATDAEMAAAVAGVQSAVDAQGSTLTNHVARIAALEAGHVWAGYEEGAWLNYVNGVPVWLPGVVTGVMTEAGDFLGTEGGDLLLMEA